MHRKAAPGISGIPSSLLRKSGSSFAEYTAKVLNHLMDKDEVSTELESRINGIRVVSQLWHKGREDTKTKTDSRLKFTCCNKKRSYARSSSGGRSDCLQTRSTNFDRS